MTGFGKFEVKDKKKRHGRNPQANVDMALRARKVVTFKCFGLLRDMINRKYR
jgi:integration host factor subunit alpha